MDALPPHYANPLIERFGERFFREIPAVPGVYFMHDEVDEILYIGKAKDLRKRLAWYKNAKPGAAHESMLECLERVVRLRWEPHRTEEAALRRESELLHAIRPPFNTASAWPEAYFYIGLRVEPAASRKDSATGVGATRAKIHFQLTCRRELARGYELFGCFKHRRRTKSGYSAMLRLLHAASDTGKRRFSFPAKITRSSPPYQYATEIPAELAPHLTAFLTGRDLSLVRRSLELMLDNEGIPAFMRPAIQDDIDAVREFFRYGPKATLALKRTHGLRTRVVSHRRMEQLLLASAQEPLKQSG